MTGANRLSLLMVIALGIASCSDSSTTAERTTTTFAETTSTTAPVPSSTTLFTAVSVHIVAPEAAVSCAAAVRSGDPGVLLSAFRAARLAGNGAARCLTSHALVNYCSSSTPCEADDLERAPGPICLYECFGYHLVGIETDSVSKDGAGNLSAYLVVHLRKSSGEELPSNEALSLGRGIPAGERLARPLVVTDASSAA
jgi:hypothetical protein